MDFKAFRTRAGIGLAGAALAVCLLAVSARQARSQVEGSLPAFVRIQSTTPGQQQTGHANISGTLLAGRVTVSTSGVAAVQGVTSATNGIGITGYASSPSGTTYGVFGYTASQSGTGVTGQSVMPNGDGVRGESLSSAGDGVGGTFQSNGDEGTGVYGANMSTTGLTIGGSFRSYSTFGTGVQGLASATSGTTFGGLFTSNSNSGRGVQGMATASSGATYGVYGTSTSPNGVGVFGTSVDNVGVRGNATAATGANYGGYFQTSSSAGYGVFAFASSTSGNPAAGYFRTDSPSGYAAYALQNAASGSNRGVLSKALSPEGIAVQGWASSTSGENFGVIGQADSTSGWGVYCLGDFASTGIKAFRIDHPLDPTNKYLTHFCTEGAEALNAYSGNVRTDAKGYATVRLPDYFEAVNRDARYQLTVVDEGDRDGFVSAKVVRKIRGNTFVVRSSAPDVEVSWRVEAVRNDPYARAHVRPDVAMKPDNDRGTYQHPELYGQPLSKGSAFNAQAAAASESKGRQTGP
ncbi:MAG: hypothetical protein JST30_01290 [Armatimonadetes bacterium]|nr:hypothetical protein [Armatimonadota bacterium]